MVPTIEPPVISFSDLCQTNCKGDILLNIVKEALCGPDACGLLAVSNVPALNEKRSALLPMALDLASAPPEHIKKYEDKVSRYSVGWSVGREALRSSNGVDTHKISLYANPNLDDPSAGNKALENQYPSVYRPNIWPDDVQPNLKPAFKALGRLVCEVADKVLACCRVATAQHYSALGKHCEESGLDLMHATGPNQRCNKGRLLHYLPMDPKDTCNLAEDAWCGWHLDHGMLTGLTVAMFHDAPTGQQVVCTDAKAGLHVRTASGRQVRVVVPANQLLFQAGESLQVASGGFLRATEHCVVPPEHQTALSRSVFVVFCQPKCAPLHISASAEAPLHPCVDVGADDIGVARWKAGMTFGQFAELTVQEHYPDCDQAASKESTSLTTVA